MLADVKRLSFRDSQLQSTVGEFEHTALAYFSVVLQRIRS